MNSPHRNGEKRVRDLSAGARFAEILKEKGLRP